MFKDNILNIYGDVGKQWLDDLPGLLTTTAKQYGLSDLKPVDTLTYNYVLRGRQGPKSIVLKLGMDEAAFEREAAVLRAFSGFGAVEVLSESRGMLLLECATPGISLKSHFPKDDEAAITIAANMIKRLHKCSIPGNHPFPHIRDCLNALNHDYAIPAEYMQKARHLRDQLLQNPSNVVLLHGDLHHDNILQHADTWVAIDPKGVIGESTYEVAAFIRNPMPELLNHANHSDIIQARIMGFSKMLEMPPQRILDWCFVQAALAWVWALEDGCDVDYFRNLTKSFHLLRNSNL